MPERIFAWRLRSPSTRRTYIICGSTLVIIADPLTPGVTPDLSRQRYESTDVALSIAASDANTIELSGATLEHEVIDVDPEWQKPWLRERLTNEAGTSAAVTRSLVRCMNWAFRVAREEAANV